VSSTEVTVAVAVNQPDLVSHPGHCSVDPEPLARIGASRWRQVRVVRGRDRATSSSSVDDDGFQRGLIAIASHGGEIEPHTDEQAERVATALAVSTWRCRGFDGTQSAVARWHITSADIDPGASRSWSR
jgi:hypothetical protein